MTRPRIRQYHREQPVGQTRKLLTPGGCARARGSLRAMSVTTCALRSIRASRKCVIRGDRRVGSNSTSRRARDATRLRHQSTVGTTREGLATRQAQFSRWPDFTIIPEFCLSMIITQRIARRRHRAGHLRSRGLTTPRAVHRAPTTGAVACATGASAPFPAAASANRAGAGSDRVPVRFMIEARWFSTVRWLICRSAAMFLLG
jgi:hypothetical protein